MKKITRAFFTLALGGMLFTGCNQPAGDNAETTESSAPEQDVSKGQSMVAASEGETPNILQVALGSPDHTTLVAAVQAAELEDVLVNAGPFTVFAPTNAAFDALPPGTVEDLVKPENKATLANIIKYHAAPGKYTGANIKGVMMIGQATGDKVVVEEKDGATYVNGAKILGTVEASNGVVHVIDGVLLPPAKN
ncbi:MAG: fasciclin domain-containing protein [Flavobacteriales bacterium]|nr:fasciclin domain-containing protein [Flavobacteriales bacterium]